MKPEDWVEHILNNCSEFKLLKEASLCKISEENIAGNNLFCIFNFSCSLYLAVDMCFLKLGLDHKWLFNQMYFDKFIIMFLTVVC